MCLDVPLGYEQLVPTRMTSEAFFRGTNLKLCHGPASWVGEQPKVCVMLLQWNHGMGMASNLHNTAADIVDVYQKRMVPQHWRSKGNSNINDQWIFLQLHEIIQEWLLQFMKYNRWPWKKAHQRCTYFDCTLCSPLPISSCNRFESWEVQSVDYLLNGFSNSKGL